MKLYDTLTNQIKPLAGEDGRVSVYVCGITPYDTTHLGHAFLYVTFDVLIRYLESTGYQVVYTQNVTDIDDDILRKAKELNMFYLDLAERETNRFLSDLRALNVRMPDHYPHATQEIDGMVEIISKLIDKGHAYVRDGNVYFDIDTYEGFGQLSKLSREEMIAIARERGGNPDDPLRDDPLDFLLWQRSAEGEPAWDSPWSKGRPGWHIECSTMSLKYLGASLTIHGGGADLIFPHHECERAQSECYTGISPFVKHWMHVGMLRYQGEKMSKSLGNLVLVDRLLQNYSPDAVRLALISHHYQESWEYQDSMIEEAEKLAQKIRIATSRAPAHDAELQDTYEFDLFRQAMEDNLNTPRAVELLRSLSEEIIQNDDNNKACVLRQIATTLGLTLR